MNVYIDSPLTASYLQSLTYLLQTTNHEASLEHHKWNSRKLLGFIINIILRDLFNGNESSIIKEIKDTMPAEYEYLSILTADMAVQIEETLAMGCGVKIDYLVKEVKFVESMIFLELEVSDEL